MSKRTLPFENLYEYVFLFPMYPSLLHPYPYPTLPYRTLPLPLSLPLTPTPKTCNQGKKANHKHTKGRTKRKQSQKYIEIQTRAHVHTHTHTLTQPSNRHILRQTNKRAKKQAGKRPQAPHMSLGLLPCHAQPPSGRIASVAGVATDALHAAEVWASAWEGGGIAWKPELTSGSTLLRREGKKILSEGKERYAVLLMIRCVCRCKLHALALANRRNPSVVEVNTKMIHRYMCANT